MSNLILPDLSFTALDKSLNGKPSKRIGYETTAERKIGSVIVRHHGSMVADIEPAQVFVTNAGWNSKTTIQRLNKIVRDNGIPFSIGIKDGCMALRDSNAKHIRYSNSILFIHTSEGWKYSA